MVLRQTEHPDSLHAADCGHSSVFRAVVDEDDLVSLVSYRFEAPFQPPGRLDGDDDDRGAQVVAFKVERSMTRSMKP